MLYRGGLKVYTSLDLKFQKTAEEAIQWGLQNLDKRQGFRPLNQVSSSEESRKKLQGIIESYAETGQPPKGPLLGKVMELSPTQAEIQLEDPNFNGILNIDDAAWAKVEALDELLHPGDQIYVRILGIFEEEEEELPEDPDEVIQEIPDEEFVGPLPEELPVTLYRFALEQIPEVQGALVAIDPKTGAIRAMVGGYDFSVSKFNRCVQAKRQPGSAFKPFIYETAIKQGYTLADIFIDSPIIYQDETQDKDWKPVNYYQKFFGPTTIREALEKSRNVITIKVLKKVGIDETIETAQEMGIDSPLAPDLSMALGSSGISLLELTSAYGVFASGGMKARPFGILKVEDAEGNILEDHQPYLERAVDEQTAYLMTQALMGVVDHGTGWRAKALGRPVAGKTGTTNNYVDAWFIGFTPDIVTGVWVGFDEYRTLGDVETGSKAAAPIWVKFMKEYILDHQVQTFPVPGGIKFAPIDRKTGLLATGDCPNVFMEAFKEGTEPEKICNAHQISQDHFVSIDMDLSKDGRMLHPQRSNITAATNRIYCSD